MIVNFVKIDQKNRKKIINKWGGLKEGPSGKNKGYIRRGLKRAQASKNKDIVNR